MLVVSATLSAIPHPLEVSSASAQASRLGQLEGSGAPPGPAWTPTDPQLEDGGTSLALPPGVTSATDAVRSGGATGTAVPVRSASRQDSRVAEGNPVAAPAEPVSTHGAVTSAGFGAELTGVGFNWPNAVAVYVNHWDQQSVTYDDRSRPFRTAKANGVTVMRTFFGTVDSFRATRSADPAVRAAAWADLESMLDDAAANGVQLILSNYLTEEAVETLAGTTYRSWADARRALVTRGSPAWRGFQQWITESTSRFRGHPGSFSWEVMNEPGWMLGIDDGSVTHDAAAALLDTFQSQYKQAGVLVNAGGRHKYDTRLLTDGQVRLMTRNIDYLDDHIYPEGGAAEVQLTAAENYRNRVAALTGRNLPLVLGEFGTQPSPFFDAMMSGAEARGFLRIVWGFDAYDTNRFTETSQPSVLQAIAIENAERNGPVG